MSGGGSISRETFDDTVARLGISATADHLDELFRQVQAALQGTVSLREIDVSSTEPDLAFDPSGAPKGS